MSKTLPPPFATIPPAKVDSIEKLGINWKLCIVVLCLTVAFYAGINWLIFRTWLTYQANTVRLTERELASDKVIDFMRLTECSQELEPWIRDNTIPGKGNDLKQVIAFVQSIKANANAEERNSMEKKLKWIIQGEPTSILLCDLDVHPVSGKEALSLITDDNWNDTLQREDFAREKKQFLEKMLDLLASHQASAIHAVGRLNGSIQFLTVYIGFLVLSLLYLRKRLLDVLAQHADAGAKIVLPEVQKVDECVYGPLSFMISTLPSLGFIGTVLGMGAALLHANQLFSSSDKQLAIGKMTQELGFAFDTTLIALVVGLILSLGMSWLRTREFKLRYTIDPSTGSQT